MCPHDIVTGSHKREKHTLHSKSEIFKGHASRKSDSDSKAGGNMVEADIAGTETGNRKLGLRIAKVGNNTGCVGG